MKNIAARAKLLFCLIIKRSCFFDVLVSSSNVEKRLLYVLFDIADAEIVSDLDVYWDIDPKI